MSKNFLITIISVSLVLVLLLGCTIQVSDEELDAQLEEMSDEELEQVVAEVDDDAAMAGQAIKVAALNYKRAFRANNIRYARLLVRVDKLEAELNTFKSGIIGKGVSEADEEYILDTAGSTETFSCIDPDANVNNGMDRRTTVKRTGSVQGVVDQKTDHCLVEGEGGDYYHNLVEYECGEDGEIVENTINCFAIGWTCSEGACFMT